MKTYFNYEGQIGSKDIAEAISFPIGIGPFMGFGSGTIVNQSITLHTNADNISPYAKSISDRLTARNISLKGENTIPTFGLINRTGHLWISTQGDITIDNIRGSQGSWNEVLVFAVFQDIESPVLNKPSLVAYWNSSAQSFYEYYKKSINPNYAASTLVEDNPWESEISFSNLITKVEGAVDIFKNTKTMVLIGIYGTGVDAETNNNENFAIVPYCGEFPQSVPFSLDYYNTLKDSIDKLRDFTMTGLKDYPTLIEFLKTLSLPEKEEEVVSTAGIVPIGGIIAWSGTNIPKGWAICDGNNGTPNLSGRFIMGSGGDYTIGKTGGAKDVALNENHLPQHRHEFKDYYFAEDSASLSDVQNKDILDINNKAGTKGADRNNNALIYYKHFTEYAGNSNPAKIDIIPPYYVLAYIMRVE